MEEVTYAITKNNGSDKEGFMPSSNEWWGFFNNRSEPSIVPLIFELKQNEN